MDSIYDEEVKANLFRACYIGVVPSIKLDSGTCEGGPLVVLEFLSAGLPIIGSNRLGSSNKYIINGKTGYVVPEKDPVSIKKAILSLDFDIQNKIIDNEKIKKIFLEIPNHKNQFGVLKMAIKHILN